IYDRTCRGRLLLPGLSHSWIAGARLYHGLRRLDAWHGVASWAEALEWLVRQSTQGPISEVQVWSHGEWGRARLNGDYLDIRSLKQPHPHYPSLSLLADRMCKGSEGLWWFRTCKTYGARPGKTFAHEFTNLLGCRTAGHTFIIGPWHSGLHTLLPGQEPSWPDTEGIREGTPEAPRRALWSRPGRPNTISCLKGRIPPGF
ncbi:MAG: hypothetical protein ACOCVR_02230, partial [Myxococcota bacterium]